MNDTTDQQTVKTETLELIDTPALESISRAEIDMAISTARKYPRELTRVKAEMMSFAGLDQETASACFYTLPRGGKNIQGPSVRLAEIALSCYGNLRSGSRVLNVVADGEHPHVIVQSICHDLQRNVSVSIEKRRRIVGKKLWKDNKPAGNKPPDEDDINLACNAACSIALRDAVFKVIPLALVKPVFDHAKKVAIGDAKSLADRRAKMLEAFGKMGVDKMRVFTKLEVRGAEDINLEHLETLIGLHNAIRDGETTIDEAFPEIKPADLVTTASGEKPTQAAPATPATEAPKTPQQELRTLLEGEGCTFDDFSKWAKGSGQAANADSWPDWDAVPSDLAKRLLRSPAGLVKGVKTGKGA